MQQKKYSLTDENRSQLRSIRQKLNLAAEDVSVQLGKSKAWLGQIERGKLKSIKIDDLLNLMTLYKSDCNIDGIIISNQWINTTEWGNFIDSQSELGYSYREVPILQCPHCNKKYPNVTYIREAKYCPNCGNFVHL